MTYYTGSGRPLHFFLAKKLQCPFPTLRCNIVTKCHKKNISANPVISIEKRMVVLYIKKPSNEGLLSQRLKLLVIVRTNIPLTFINGKFINPAKLSFTVFTEDISNYVTTSEHHSILYFTKLQIYHLQSIIVVKHKESKRSKI